MDVSGRSGEKWPRRGPYRCGGCGMMPKKTACICIKSGTTPPGASSSTSPPAEHSGGSGPYGQGGSGGYRMPRSMATTPRAQAALANKLGAAGGGGGSGGIMMAGSSGLGLRLDTNALSASQHREPAPLGYADVSTTSGGSLTGGARATRCGHCRTCVNPRLKKACLTLRQASSAPPPPPMGGGEEASMDMGGGGSLLFSGGAGTRGGAMDPIASSRHLALDLASASASASASAPSSAAPNAHVRSQRTVRMPRSISAPSFADWQEDGGRSAHHSFMVPETRLEHVFLTEPTKLASMPEDVEGGVDWVSEFGADDEEEDAMQHLLGGGVGPHRNLSGMKRMFGGMSKAESMPNLTALVPDDLDDPFDYDDGLDLGLGFGQSPPVPLATDLMDLDKESNLEPLNENLVGYFGMMAGPSSVEGAGALGAGGLSVSAGSHLPASNTPMESAALLMGESHPHAAASSPPQGSSSMSIHSSTSRGASEASGSGSGGSSHQNPFAGLASSLGHGSVSDARLLGALEATGPPERSSSHSPYSHSREHSHSHTVSTSMSVERRGKHQNIRQQPTDHLSAKRVSRIMANRLSAAKSRVKKLQHTADLEGRVKELQGHIDQLRPQVMSLHHEHAALAEQTQALRAKLQHAQQVKCQQEKRMADMQEEIRQLSSLQGGEYGGVMGEGGEGAQRMDVSCGGMLQGGKQDSSSGKMPMIA